MAFTLPRHDATPLPTAVQLLAEEKRSIDKQSVTDIERACT
jgi:hypothetical protein